jgi:flagella basal body P-ring formation protein FlgA
MILRLVVTLGFLARFAPAQEAACAPVEGDQILGSHLAITLPEFRRIPAELPLGNLPPAGSHRTLHAAELQSLAKRYGIDLPNPHDVCFEFPMEALNRSRVLDAMRASLQVAGADIAIAEITLNPVPRGRVEFPREKLGIPASPAQRDAVLWRGEVVYGGEHRFPIWARVRIQVNCERLVAAESLRPGQAIEASQVRQETGKCFPAAHPTLQAERATGMIALRAIAAGAEIRAELLALPNLVNRGDAVEVEVRSGGARLAFTGKAESSGRGGDLVAVRNPSSNRVFRARVDGKGKVTLDAGGNDGSN